MNAVDHNRPLLARSSRRYVAQTLNLDLASFNSTEDSAWIGFAKNLKARAHSGLAIERRSLSQPRDNLATSK